MILLVLFLSVLSGYSEVVAAWDFSNERAPAKAVPGWTTWSTNDLINHVSSTVGGLTLTHTSGAFSLFVKKIGTPAQILQFATPLLTLLDNDDGLRVYEDGINNFAGKPVFTLSGLTPGKQYRIQFVATFVGLNTEKNISIKQDNATAVNIIEGGDTTVLPTLVYSRYFIVTATADKTEVSFQFGTSGTPFNQAICGMIVEENPAPAPALLVG